jgi:hypothetical protein
MLSGYGAVALYGVLLQISLEGKGVLVTGCDTGFGHALALKLADLVRY